MNPENALEEVSDVDVWSWHGKSPADLDFGEMLELRKTILSNRVARRELDRKIEELGEVKAGKSEESQKHGIANWLRGDHLRSRAYLESAPTCEILAFAYAESILFGSYVGMAAKPNRPKLAVDALAKIARPSHQTTTLHLKALRAADRIEDAANVFKSAGSAYAETADGKWYAGLMLEDQDLYEEAEASYEEGLAIDPTHVDCLFRKAYRRDMSSEDSEAVSLYERIAKQQPTHVNALINLGVIYEDSDRYHDAIYCYRRVIAAYPQHPRALLFLKDAEASLDMYYDEDQEVRQDKKNQILKIPVSDFELSVRSRNCLAKMNIVTLADLVTKTEPELLSYKNFGETSLNEIKQILDSKGLRLGMRPEDDLEPVQPRSASGSGDFARPAQGAATPAPAFNVDPNDARLQMLCSDMNLSVRSRKCLANLNIKTVGQLVAYTHDELLAQRNFGVTSLREITDQVEQMGLSMRTVDR